MRLQTYQELYGCNNEFYMEEPSSSATLLDYSGSFCALILLELVVECQYFWKGANTSESLISFLFVWLHF